MRVVITGASGALGQAVVAQFDKNGDALACFGILEEGLGSAGKWYHAENLAHFDEARRMIRGAAAQLGGIDALVHLVGAFDWCSVEDSTPEGWRRLYSANVETSLSVVQAVLPHMDRGAAIVTIGAAAAQRAAVGMAPYAAAKSAVARLTEALADELRPRGIRANAVLPAIIDTPRNRAEMPDADPSGWTSAEAVADVIYFLASSASRGINGTGLEVRNGTR
jgi:NAD(P)-dependent dehydrogenase (short-subunit alcohol dehydrogenase family)